MPRKLGSLSDSCVQKGNPRLAIVVLSTATPEWLDTETADIQLWQCLHVTVSSYIGSEF